MHGNFVETMRTSEGLSVAQPRLHVVGSAAKHTGFYTVRKYPRDIAPIIAEYARSGDRFLRANAQRLAILTLETLFPDAPAVVTDPNLITTNGVKGLYTLFTNAGTAAIASGGTQAQFLPLTNITSALAIGDGTGAAAAASDVDLTDTGTNHFYQAAGTGNTTVTNNVLQIVVAVASADGQFAWQEVGAGNFANSGDVGWRAGLGQTSTGKISVVAAATATTGTGAKMPGAGNYVFLSHKTSAALGTKSTGTWTLTYTLTIV